MGGAQDRGVFDVDEVDFAFDTEALQIFFDCLLVMIAFPKKTAFHNKGEFR